MCFAIWSFNLIWTFLSKHLREVGGCLSICVNHQTSPTKQVNLNVHWGLAAAKTLVSWNHKKKLDGLIFSCCTSILAIHWLDAAALDPSHLNNSSNSNQLSHSFVLVVQLFGIFSTACWFFIFLDTCLMFGDICANVFSQQKWARLHRIPETCIATVFSAEMNSW